MARAPRSFSLNLGGIDNALVVRVGSGRGSRGPVYVVPVAILQLYALKGLSAADQRTLDQFFASHTLPKIDAAIATTLRIFDGSG